MPIRSDSGSANDPLGGIKKIKDIAASRKEKVEKNDRPNDIRQQALERSAFRANKPNVKCTNQKPTLAEIREIKKEAFADEFSKMGCLNCNEQSSKEADSKTNIKRRLDSNLEEGSKFNQSKQLEERAPKPRWNSGTKTSNITESNQLYGYHEPFIKNFKQKCVAVRKDGDMNELQSKSKPSVKTASVHRQIPVIQSLIMEDKRNHTDNILESRIPRHTSEPHMTLPSKRWAPSTKIHREKCYVLKETDKPTPSNGNHDDICTAAKDRNAKAMSSVAEKQCSNAFAIDKKPSEDRENKLQKERPTEKDKTIEIKKDAEAKTNKQKPLKCKILPTSMDTDVDEFLEPSDIPNFRDNQCLCQCHRKSDVTTVAISESAESERESTNPTRKVAEGKKFKLKIPFRKRPGTPRQK